MFFLLVLPVLPQLIASPYLFLNFLSGKSLEFLTYHYFFKFLQLPECWLNQNLKLTSAKCNFPFRSFFHHNRCAKGFESPPRKRYKTPDYFISTVFKERVIPTYAFRFSELKAHEAIDQSCCTYCILVVFFVLILLAFVN